MKIIFTALMLTACCTPAAAQTNETYAPGIASLQVMAGERWMSLPVIRLDADGPGDRVNISFDDLTHAYRRYTYSIEHCEADWTASDQIFTSDYVEGFSEGNTIGPGEESVNTDTLYTHYRLTIPNAECSLKMSGNYRLTVYDEDDGHRPVLSACFMVAETAASVGLNVTPNTDIDTHKSHQQVEMSVNYGSLSVTNPTEQIKTVVMQNRRWDNARVNVSPQYVTADGLRWEHCRDLIFEAGNEYRKYEILDVAYPTMGVDRMVWDGADYHAWLYPSEPRPAYVYDEDTNGAFYIRNGDNVENDIASEYIYVHFTLPADNRFDGEVYVDGAWTGGRFLPECRMRYDEARGLYTATVVQKQGYYSYQYVLVDADGASRTVPTEGNYYQTENKYQALVYYRERGGRTDRLVGYAETEYE